MLPTGGQGRLSRAAGFGLGFQGQMTIAWQAEDLGDHSACGDEPV